MTENPGQKLRILLIDDSEITVEGLKLYLGQQYEVHTAYNGLEAIGILKSNQNDFDLIITDMLMPKCGGSQVISFAKENYPDISIIAITGWGKHQFDLATEAEADLVLDKPFELDELDHSIFQLLSTKTI